MQHFLDAAGYGNRDMAGGIDSFWLTGGLRISLWEQVEFLSRLQQGDPPFSPAVMTAVTDMMLTENGVDYRIRAKTGLATLAGSSMTSTFEISYKRDDYPSPLRYQRAVFEKEIFTGALASGSAFIVFENDTGKVIGSSRFYDWDPVHREVAIGFSFLARSHWGGNTNQQKKQLMLNHAWQYAQRVWLHIGRDNWRSRKAAEKIGASFSHDGMKELFGVVREYAFYTIEKPLS
jgi:N-acetyltransferase